MEKEKGVQNSWNLPTGAENIPQKGKTSNTVSSGTREGQMSQN